MVFGWGKKKEEPKESHYQKSVPFSEITKILTQILDLRTTQTLSDIKSLRDATDPLILELISIGKTLEKDDLQVTDIDKHLRIIVLRGKQQVIDMIKKDALPLPPIRSYEDAETLNSVLHQMLKKIGDVLGRHTRVIHIFAKKYAEKLKEILIQMNSNTDEIQKLLQNFNRTKSLYEEISNLLKEVENIKNNIKTKEQRIIKLSSDIDSTIQKINSDENLIDKIKTSAEYQKYLELKQELDILELEKNHLKNTIDSQFTKISRPLGRYEYVSSLDKAQKLLLSELIKDPLSVLTLDNKDSIIIIIENVRKGINSGSISVKDYEKSLTSLTEIENSLDQFIKQINTFLEKRQHIQNQISSLKMDELFKLTKELDHNSSNKNEFETKLKSLQSEIELDNSSLSKLISEIEIRLKDFSNTEYSVVY
jgi:chromosome segregation ATPase